MLVFGYKMANVAALTLAAALPAPATAQTADGDVAKVYLSLSYIGDDWTAEATRTVEAMAASSTYKDRVQFEVQASGPNAQTQIQQINAMVQAGADAIVIYPISPTALNQVVRNACDRGVHIFAFDAEISEPCAHNVHIDQAEAGRRAMRWLAEEIGGEGKIVYLSGVPGTSTDTKRTAGTMEVLAEYPGIEIVARAPGMWAQAITRTEMSQILANYSWDEIDGVLGQAGCYTIFSMQDEADIADADKIPCAGEGENGQRIQMLPIGTESVEGANGTYRPMGVRGYSYASPPVSAAVAFKLAMDAIDGAEIPHSTLMPLPEVTNDNIKLCLDGSFEELTDGCNAFQPSIMRNPGWFSEIYHPQTPEIGLNAALEGKPEF